MPRIVRFYAYGGPDVLRIEQAHITPPKENEVQIRVKALGLNRAESLMRAGNYIERPTLPSGLGLEAAGMVAAVGKEVTRFAVGDAVSIIPPISMVRWPAYGEIITFPEDNVVKHPASLSWEEAAATWMQYLTAYGALVDIARLQKNEYVAITAASSSVGLAAIQIANRVGAIPIAITRTAAKKQALLHAGAQEVIAFQQENLEERLMAITGSQGVRVVFDPIGGPIFTPLTAAMSTGGILIEYGGLSPDPTPFPLFTVLAKTLTLRGYLVHELLNAPERLERAKAFITQGLTAGALKPVIAKVFPLEAIQEAHRFLESSTQFGKVVVRLDTTCM